MEIQLFLSSTHDTVDLNKSSFTIWKLFFFLLNSNFICHLRLKSILFDGIGFNHRPPVTIGFSHRPPIHLDLVIASPAKWI